MYIPQQVVKREGRRVISEKGNKQFVGSWAIGAVCFKIGEMFGACEVVLAKGRVSGDGACQPGHGMDVVGGGVEEVMPHIFVFDLWLEEALLLAYLHPAATFVQGEVRQGLPLLVGHFEFVV
jgi:hypothetical protein